MPRLRRRTRRNPVKELTGGQELELIFGTSGNSNFASPLEARAAWFYHRERLLEDFTEGRRPWGFWKFESGLDGYPESENQWEWLWRNGYLDAEEKAKVLAQWIKTFDLRYENERAIITHVDMWRLTPDKLAELQRQAALLGEVAVRRVEGLKEVLRRHKPRKEENRIRNWQEVKEFLGEEESIIEEVGEEPRRLKMWVKPKRERKRRKTW
ncbi:MAG: hypothetical protein AB1330_10780 [Bacillota bacterium]